MSLRILLGAIVPLLTLSNALPLEDSANKHHLFSRNTITCNNGGPADVVSQDLTDFINILNSVSEGNIPSGVTVTEPSIFLPSFFEDDSLNLLGGVHASVEFVVTGQEVFTTTYVSYATMASAMQEYQSTCCGVFPMCISGTIDGVRGDTGESVTVAFGNPNNCNELADSCIEPITVLISA